MQAGEPTVDDSSPERYISGSQKSSEIGLDDQATSPTSSEDLTTYIVEDSQGTNSMDEGNDHALSDEEFSSMENIINKNNVRRSNEGSVSESDEQSAKKAGIS